MEQLQEDIFRRKGINGEPYYIDYGRKNWLEISEEERLSWLEKFPTPVFSKGRVVIGEQYLHGACPENEERLEKMIRNTDLGGEWPTLVDGSILAYSVDEFFGRIITSNLIIFEGGGMLFPGMLYRRKDSVYTKEGEIKGYNFLQEDGRRSQSIVDELREKGYRTLRTTDELVLTLEPIRHIGESSFLASSTRKTIDTIHQEMRILEYRYRVGSNQVKKELYENPISMYLEDNFNIMKTFDGKDDIPFIIDKSNPINAVLDRFHFNTTGEERYITEVLDVNGTIHLCFVEKPYVGPITVAENLLLRMKAYGENEEKVAQKKAELWPKVESELAKYFNKETFQVFPKRGVELTEADISLNGEYNFVVAENQVLTAAPYKRGSYIFRQEKGGKVKYFFGQSANFDRLVNAA